MGMAPAHNLFGVVDEHMNDGRQLKHDQDEAERHPTSGQRDTVESHLCVGTTTTERWPRKRESGREEKIWGRESRDSADMAECRPMDSRVSGSRPSADSRDADEKPRPRAKCELRHGQAVTENWMRDSQPSTSRGTATRHGQVTAETQPRD